MTALARRIGRSTFALGCACLAAVLAPVLLRAQLPADSAAPACTVLDTRSSLGPLSGVPIRRVDLVVDQPTAPAGGGDALTAASRHLVAATHVRTREGVVRRQLLFAAGDTVDTLAVAETLRRLRRSRVFEDVRLEARRCGAGAPVDLTLATRDAWSVRPVFKAQGGGTMGFGAQDANFLGEMRSAMYTHSPGVRGGEVLSYSDPWLLGTNVAGSARLSDVGQWRRWHALLQSHSYSIFQPWTAEAEVSHTAHLTPISMIRSLHGSALAGHVVASSRTGVTTLLMGGEVDSASFAPLRKNPRPADTIPLPTQMRRFAGGDVGLSRRTAVYDTVGWLTPGGGILDVAEGLEGEAVLGLGRDRVANVPAAHYDAWVGRMWIPRPGLLATGDAWLSGYAGRGTHPNRITRVMLGGWSAAPGGSWSAHLNVERLSILDPDLRANAFLGGTDLTLKAVPLRDRQSDGVVTASLERGRHLAMIGQTSVLDIAAFGAASYRWDQAGRDDEVLRIGMLGAGLRLVGTRSGLDATRLDLGFPVAGSARVRRRPVLGIAMTTSFEAMRQRAGRRF